MEDDTSADDSNQTLSQISQKHGRSIVNMLVDIQESVVLQSKSTSFLERLECLQPIKYPYYNPPRKSKTGEVIPPRSTDDPAVEYKFMRRCYVNVLDIPEEYYNYVALSYTWQPQEGENETSGKYWIENKQRTGFDMSPVRNTVLDRITNFMSVWKYHALWIDQHCITQTTTCTSGSCSHEDCNEKRDAVHAMDLVYSASSAPTALLSHYIKSKDDLLLLRDLFNVPSKLMEPDPSTDGEPDNRVPTRAIEAINLVYEIISEPWWARAWPFQENILAMSQMQLLLRHAPELEDIKATIRFTSSSFYTVPGELCISSKFFSTRATWLWVAVKRLLESNGEILSEGDKRCVNMLFEIDRAIRGTRQRHMHFNYSCVVASFVQIVERKAIANYWDRLAIIGNCSRFSIRLQPLELQRQGHSISISTLALFLLNGEVLDNGKEQDSQKMLNLKVSLYLEARLLDNESDTEAFNGNCRLPDVVLTIKGVRTRGHLWQLGEVIGLSKAEDSPASMRRVPEFGDAKSDMRIKTMKNLFVTQDQLRKLIRTLEDLAYTPLAADLKASLEHPISRNLRLLFPDQLAQGDGSPMESVTANAFRDYARLAHKTRRHLGSQCTRRQVTVSCALRVQPGQKGEYTIDDPVIGIQFDRKRTRVLYRMIRWAGSRRYTIISDAIHTSMRYYKLRSMMKASKAIHHKGEWNR
ncbi:hypothetical protein B0H65DRAFT_242019 [Neurospora tetraspora]|uniref:Heterokaryon incompatibility domain-containing protein n=1 Tax=Neurospora tetraspora TaxID=94610 RepID=A0AAE0JDH9_9PEZI|nr:hypothetical protein B0H65DRAFT_242019 [Neurospora tetraspora]